MCLCRDFNQQIMKGTQMKKLFLTFCLLLPTLFANAEQPLTKDLVVNLQSTMTQLEKLQDKYPALKEDMNANLFNTKNQLALIEAAGATNAIEKVVKGAGFDDIESFLEYAQRMTSSMFTVMKEQMPPGMNMDALIKRQESTLSAMKSSGLPETTIAEMKKGLAEMKAQAEMMEKAAVHAKPGDVSFMRQNLAWVMQQFEASMGAN